MSAPAVDAATGGAGGDWVKLGRVGALVDKRISTLQKGALANRSSDVAMIAHLRNAVGKLPGSAADIWSLTLADELAGPAPGDDPTTAEVAVHIAMTLYAVHQQSVPREMHRRGHGLGRSLHRLNTANDNNDPIRRRFLALGTADSLDELAHHARGLIKLLRVAYVPLDYGLLADQLVRWQHDGAIGVRLQWAREFYRTEPDRSDNSPASPQAVQSAR